MRYRLSTLLAGILLLVVCSTASASTEEVQGWRTSNDHIHTQFNAPMLGTLSSSLTVPVTTLLHNRAGGRLTFVRWADGSNVKQTVSLNVVGTGAPEQSVVTNLTLNPSSFDASGWREARVTSNFVDTNGDREFTTTRTCIFVVNGKSRSDYCAAGTTTSVTSAGRCGGGAWYAATEYSVAFVDCRDVKTAQTRSLVAGDTIRVKAQAGSLNVHLDPAFHAGNPGTVLLANGPTGTWRTITIPSGLAAGTHKLHVRDQRSNGEAGVYTLLFTIGSGSPPPPPPPDGDADGVPDSSDQCPADPGPSPTGCPAVDTTPDNPTGLVQLDQTQTTTTVEWNPVNAPGQVGFHVYNGSTRVAVVPPSQTSYTYTGLTCGTTYTASVYTITYDGTTYYWTEPPSSVSMSTLAC